MRFGAPASPEEFDQQSTVSASESYVGDILYR